VESLCLVCPLKDPVALDQAMQRTAVPSSGSKKFLTRGEQKTQSSQSSSILSGVIPELHPPPGLPQGNVGTPRSVIRQMIRKCLLPTSALKSMGIRAEAALPEERSQSKVKFTYADEDEDEVEDELFENVPFLSLSTMNCTHCLTLEWLAFGRRMG